jgi:hypothetical protein
MIYTARQVEDLWKANGGSVVLPYRARLSPLAADWVRAKKLVVGYADGDAAALATKAKEVNGALAQALGDAAKGKPLLWWCDGPCGTAKAALMAQARETTLVEADIPGEAKKLIAAIKHIASEVKAGKAGGAVLMVGAGATALVYANRCPSLRAILGTCLESVEQGIQQVAANVLVIEYPHKTLQQIKNILGRFARGQRRVGDETVAALKELASCG